jgi:hypothetical protein
MTDPREVRIAADRPGTGPTAFRRGWIASDSLRLPRGLEGWDRVRISDLDVAIHPALEWSLGRSGGAQLLLLGRVIDTERGEADQTRLMDGLLRSMRSGLDGLVREAAYLAGRFLMMAADREQLVVIPDASASIPANWVVRADRLTMSSHRALLAEAADLDTDHELLELLRDASARSPYVVYPPGVRLLQRGARPVLPNHLLRRARSGIRHERFYPFPETELGRDGYDRFRYHFTEHVRLLSTGAVEVSLTSGRDSGASLAALVRNGRRNVGTWTGLRSQHSSASERADAVGAGLTAERFGYPHRTLVVGGTESDEFARAFGRTFPVLPQYRAMAAATTELGTHAVTLQSMVAEVATGFYKVRGRTDSGADALAATFSRERIANSEYGVASFEEFIEYAEFTPDRFGPWSRYDLQYWEHRVGLWAALRVQELEVTHRLELPFNSRHVLEGLASAPWRVRVAKHFLQAYASGY